MEQYSDLMILDCNRLHSIEGVSGNNNNPALFTNEIGNGVKLNVGDEVSIQNAFVSEVGAGADTIEIKGEPLLDSSGNPLTKTINYTDEINEYPTRSWDNTSINLITGYQKITSTNKPFTYQLRDDECNIETQYWTSNNGRGYIGLPRRWAYNETYTGISTSGIVAENWNQVDEATSGRIYWYQRYQTACEDDYQYYRDDFVPGANSEYPEGHFIMKNNNKRFTVLRKQGETFFNFDVLTYGQGANFQATLPTVNNRDPAIYEYDYYKEIINIKVNKGFNSPSDISDQITNQLKKADEPKVYKYKDDSGVVQHITTTNSTNTWKPFNAVAFQKWDSTHFGIWNAGANNQEAVEYYAPYQNIAVKRPDLFILGRKCNTAGGHAIYPGVGGLLHADVATNTLKTSFRYPEDLVNLSNLFKAQGNYPELFTGRSFFGGCIQEDGFSTIDNCRFLHLDYNDNSNENRLGNDGYDATSASKNTASIPVFFHYNKSQENILFDNPSTTQLSYGFATSYITPFGFLGIELHPELMDGATRKGSPDFTYTHYLAGAGYVVRDIPNQTKIGWDWHFNAFSTVAIIPFTSRLDRDYINNNEFSVQNGSQKLNKGDLTNISADISQTYIGANDPLFNFDAVSSRFYFSRLHTSENAGQTDIQAGITETEAPIINIDASKEVYKMNPRFNQYEYCPDIRPYRKSYVGHANFLGKSPATNTSQTIDIMSRQVEPFTIFDSNSGIFISDLGYNENDFNRGLWSILGFRYSQFNTVESLNLNRLSRVDAKNKNALSIMTTNCEVVSEDTISYNVNPYGATFFTNQLATPYAMVGPHPFTVNGSNTLNGSSIPIYPAITKNTESIQLTAIDLPRKMLRPYYLIRSNIIEQPKYIGHDKALLPVVGLCDKQYSGGDFYFGSDNTFSFRITKPRTLTSITTSIHDPDGTFSNCNLDSAVIYKVIKNMNVDTDILGGILNKKK